MAKMLTFEDLEADKQTEEKIELKEEEELEGLYDLIIPPGTPSYIIYDLVEEFDLEAVDREINVGVVEYDKRNLIALRGKLEDVEAAQHYLKEELEAYINS